METSEERKITVAKDGPHIVSGDIPLTVEVIPNILGKRFLRILLNNMNTI